MTHVRSGRAGPWHLRRRATLAAAALLASMCDAGGASAAEHAVVIDYSAYTVAHPAFATIIQGMKSEAETFGSKFLLANSNNSASQQVSDGNSLQMQGATSVIVTPAGGRYGVRISTAS